MTMDPDVFNRDHIVQGDPNSGAYKIVKSQERQWKKTISRLAAGNTVNVATLAELNAITGTANQGGMVWGDSTGANNGVYAWDATSSPAAWVRIAGLPHTATVLTNVAGTANAITADTQNGVDPAEVQLFFLPDPPGTNTSGPMTIDLNSGEATYNIKAAAGSDPAAGDVIENVGTLFFKVDNSEIRQLVSSQTGATFDHQGDYAGGTTYTEGQVVTGSDDAWYQLKVASATGDDPVSGGSGDWLKILDSVVSDGSVTFAKLDSTAYDFLEAFNIAEGNSAATNVTNFAALEAAISGRVIDMGGAVIPVTSEAVIPNGNFYKNGFFRIANYEDGVTADLPARDTLKGETVNISNNKYYASWAQDKCHTFTPIGSGMSGAKELVFAAWNEGVGHGTSDTHVVIARSDDGGRNWENFEHPIQSTSHNTMAFAMGEVDGQQLLVVREGDPATEYKILSRRLYERRESQTATIQTTSGSPTVTITLKDGGSVMPHGVVNDNRVNIASASGAVGGITLSGVKTVSNVTDDSFQVTASGNASSNATEDITFIIEFYEDPFVEIKFGSNSFGTQILAEGGTPFSSDPAVLHSLAVYDGGFYCGAHGGGATGPYLIRVDDVLLSSRSIGSITQIASLTDGIEPSVAVDQATGEVYGTLRNFSNSYPFRLWHWDGVTFTTHDFSNNNFNLQQPAPIRIHDGKPYCFVTGDRSRASAGAGNVNLYLATWPSLADFEANGFTNVRFIKWGRGYYSNLQNNDVANGVGVGSMCILSDGTIEIFHSSEHAGFLKDHDGQPDVYGTSIRGLGTSDSVTLDYQELAGPSAEGQRVVAPEKRHRIAHALIESGGTKIPIYEQDGIILSVNKSGLGQYDFTFQTDNGATLSLGTTRYAITWGAFQDNNHNYVSVQTATGFTIISNNDGTTSPDDGAFFVKVEVPVVWNR